MDIATIDQQYGQLQAEFQDVAKSVGDFAQKLQAAAAAGDQNAREWLLDLKQIALDIKDEQIQCGALLAAIHGWAAANAAQPPAPAPAPVTYVQQPPQPAYAQPMMQPQMGGYGFGGGGGGGGGGLFGGFLNSGFGRAMEMGAGIGLGEDLINNIF